MKANLHGMLEHKLVGDYVHRQRKHDRSGQRKAALVFSAWARTFSGLMHRDQPPEVGRSATATQSGAQAEARVGLAMQWLFPFSSPLQTRLQSVCSSKVMPSTRFGAKAANLSENSAVMQ